MTADANPDVKDMTFEQALKELEAVVGRLEHGEATLEESIALYERGNALRGLCEQRLNDAQERVALIQLGEGGRPEGLRRVEKPSEGL